MTDIAPVSRPISPVIGLPSRVSQGGQSSGQPSRGNDSVEVSAIGKYLSQLHELPAVRQDLVEKVRQQIADGSYDTPEKIDALMESLAEDLA